MFGFMSERIDIGNYMKAKDSLLPAFTISDTMPSYLTKLYLLSTILFSPSVRGALGAVKHIENASEAAVKRRKQEIEENKDDKRDMLRKLLEINVDRGEKINFTYEHIYVESHSSMYVQDGFQDFLHVGSSILTRSILALLVPIQSLLRLTVSCIT
jgi:hypothetical protein